MAFIVLWILSFILPKKESKKSQNLKSKSEFVITMTWPDESRSDVDMWVEDGMGHLVSFKRREQGLVHLERDDLGWTNDTIQTPQGEVTLKDNTELVHIRGIVVGEVVVWTHMYSRRETDANDIVVKIKIEKMNPYSIVMINEVKLGSTGDAKTLGRFTIKDDGTVTDVNFLEKEFPMTVGGWSERSDSIFP